MNIEYQLISELLNPITLIRKEKERKAKILDKKNRWNKLSSEEKIKHWNITHHYHLRHRNWIKKYKEFKHTGTKLNDNEVKEWSNMHHHNAMYAKEQIERLKKGDSGVDVSPHYR